MDFRLQLSLAVVLGLLAGAASVHYVVQPAPPATQAVHTSDTAEFANKRYGFGVYDLKPATLLRGWRAPENWGTWMKEATASFVLPNSQPAGADIELILDARIKVKSREAQHESPLVQVRCNGKDIGSWPISKTGPQLQQRFIIPQSVFNRATPAIIEIEKSRTGADVGLGLRGFQMRAPPLLQTFKGRVDGCDGTRIWGWAVADGLPVPVLASVDAEPVEAVFRNVLRPDLEANALPNSAGFELNLMKPPPTGSQISLSMYGSAGQTPKDFRCPR